MKKIPILLMILSWVTINGFGQNGGTSNKYHSPSEIHKQMLDLQKANKNVSSLHLIGHSYSGIPVHLIEIGAETSAEKKSKPAVFVAANFEGTSPLASEAAIYLIKDLIDNPDHYKNLTWYILPVGNPEGASHFFNSPKMVSSRNFRPFNDDMDDQVDEVFGIMKFMIDHPQIALVMHYGSTNFCIQPPKGGRKGETNLSFLRIPKNYAAMLNADPNKRYTMDEVKEMVKTIVPKGMVVDDSMIAGMLGLGAAVNPLAKDLTIYTSYSKKYKKFLKEKGYSTERLDPMPAKDGSFELWAYYQLGLPSFSQDFWGVPKLEPEKPDSAAKTEQAVKPEKPAKPEQAAKPGQAGKKSSEKTDAEKVFLSYNDSLLNAEGFVNWTPFNHPQLGEVEIGGRVPYADMVPQVEEIEKAIVAQVPWIYELTKGIPDLSLDAKKIKDIGDGIYKLEVWITNEGKYHFPLAMGSKNKVPAPAVITLNAEGLEFLQGKERTPIASIEAGKKQKFTWLLRSTKSDQIKLSIRTVNARGSETTINLGGAK